MYSLGNTISPELNDLNTIMNPMTNHHKRRFPKVLATNGKRLKTYFHTFSYLFETIHTRLSWNVLVSLN